MKERIHVIRKLPGEPAERTTIPNTLSALQSLVGGYVESVTIAPDCAILCNEHGRLRNMEENCTICGINFVGPIVIVGVTGCDFDDAPVQVAVFLDENKKAPIRAATRIGAVKNYIEIV